MSIGIKNVKNTLFFLAFFVDFTEKYMSAYKCCKCDNILAPQGPINAIVIHSSGRFETPLSIQNTGRIVDDSIQKILKDIPGGQSVSLLTTSSVSGAKGIFTFNNLSLLVPNDKAIRSVSQTLTICCSVCGACCQYNDN